jgi:hypothetical protein
MTFGEPLDDFDYWRLCDELSVFQAALLTVGINPSDDEGAYCENHAIHERPHGYEAAKTAISNALKKGYLGGSLVPQYNYDDQGYANAAEGTVDIEKSTVDVDSLIAWLDCRGLKNGFFSRDKTEKADYLDSKHPRYAPKLAAAVKAWLAVEDPGGKHPKQALSKWLREHASEFGLSDDEGKPNETGIEEAAKVANWQPGGGAPKTPS